MLLAKALVADADVRERPQGMFKWREGEKSEEGEGIEQGMS